MLDRLLTRRGETMNYTQESGDNGNPFKYTFTLNHPVPPGGKFVLKMEGTLDGLGTQVIKPTGEPDVFELQFRERVGNHFDPLDQSNGLPPGAILLEKSPADLTASTNGNHIEVRATRCCRRPAYPMCAFVCNSARYCIR